MASTMLYSDVSFARAAPGEECTSLQTHRNSGDSQIFVTSVDDVDCGVNTTPPAQLVRKTFKWSTSRVTLDACHKSCTQLLAVRVKQADLRSIIQQHHGNCMSNICKLPGMFPDTDTDTTEIQDRNNPQSSGAESVTEYLGHDGSFAHVEQLL